MKKFAYILLVASLALGCRGSKLGIAELHTRAFVADLHCDTVLRMLRGYDITERHDEGDIDLPRLIDGGVDLEAFACWLDTDTPPESCVVLIDRMLDTLEAAVARNQNRLDICRTAAEAAQIVGSGRIAAFLAIENGVAIAGDLDNLKHFYDRGVRYMTLTHTASSDWVISSADTMPAFDGLTEFGFNVVREMNRLGMIIDISHAHPAAVDHVLSITNDPIIASHSCVHALCEHDRNLTDEQIKAIAAGGGVIGINFYNGYLSEQWSRVADSLWELHRPEIDSLRTLYADNDSLRRNEVRGVYRLVSAQVDTLAPVNVATVVDHIDYIVNLVGPDHVGLGSDYDGVPAMPQGLGDVSMLPNITDELAARGYSETDIKKILGGNFMRVFQQVCDPALTSN